MLNKFKARHWEARRHRYYRIFKGWDGPLTKKLYWTTCGWSQNIMAARIYTEAEAMPVRMRMINNDDIASALTERVL